MKDRIKDYFSFNSGEQRGLIILLGLMLLSVLVNLFLPSFFPEKEFDIRPFQKEVEEFMASVEKADSIKALQTKMKPFKKYEDDDPVDLERFLASPYYFDPNEMSEEQWIELGLGSKIANNICRYREKGGEFRDKKGFSRIYGMSDSIFAILEPYILIKEKASEKKSWKKSPTSDHSKSGVLSEAKESGSSFTKYVPDTVMVELNSADSISLLGLHGIGPAYASRIIKYRQLLGGFINTHQLLEVRGMDSVRYQQFSYQLKVDTLQIRKLDLNTVSFKEMLRHPYFEYYLVKAVFNYKDEIKAFDSVEQLRNIPVMYDELYDKVSPYLEVNSK